MNDEILKLGNQICFPLYAASRLVTQAYRPLLAELGLTYPQYLVMLVLWENDGLSVGQIGELLYLDSGTLTPLLKRLEKQSLLSRKRSVEDDRTVENWLTEAGLELKKRAIDVPEELLCNAQLDMSNLAVLKGNLESLILKLLSYHGIQVPDTTQEKNPQGSST